MDYRGDSTVLIKKSFKHEEEDKYQTKEFQATFVKVKTKTYEIPVCAVY